MTYRSYLLANHPLFSCCLTLKVSVSADRDPTPFGAAGEVRAILCSLSRRFPQLAARFLDRAPARRSFREETITDLLTGALSGLERLGLEVDLPREDLTGADMEWWFVNVRTGSRLRVLIQAKRATPAKTWQSARFSELAHPDDSGDQSQDLLDEARRSPFPTVALYAFYCPKTLVDQANAESGRRLTGVDFADAVFVRTLISKDLAGKRISLAAGKARYGWPNRKLKALRSRLFSLHDLLCVRRPMRAYVGLRRSAMAYFLVSSAGSRRTIASLHVPEPEEILNSLAGLNVAPVSASDYKVEGESVLGRAGALPAYVTRLLGDGVDPGGGGGRRRGPDAVGLARLINCRITYLLVLLYSGLATDDLRNLQSMPICTLPPLRSSHGFAGNVAGAISRTLRHFGGNLVRLSYLPLEPNPCGTHC